MSKLRGRFFQILSPSHNIWTLKSLPKAKINMIDICDFMVCPMSEMFFIMVKKYMTSRMSVAEWTAPNQLVFYALINLNKRI